ncbi:MAG: hypothetical protein FWE94_08415, partial [Coriobacteriia bacterium]|nr:hypothetical protein [Coriobacteriia bacterium]
MLPLIYTDTDGRDIGRKLTYTADMEIGADTANTFELKVNLDDRLPVGGGSFIYRESSEFGGIVDAIGTETMTSPAKAIYRGRTWTGVLAKRVLEPPAGLSHLTYKGEANAGIAWIIGLLSLGDLFIVRPEHSGFAVDYQFYRYIDAYSGICMMLTSVGAKLKLAWNGDKIELWCEPVMDYTQTREIDSDRLRFTVEKVLRPVNSLVCLGKGDLEERTVMHFYANADREVVDGGGNPLPQSLFGADCVEEVY